MRDLILTASGWQCTHHGRWISVPTDEAVQHLLSLVKNQQVQLDELREEIAQMRGNVVCKSCHGHKEPGIGGYCLMCCAENDSIDLFEAARRPNDEFSFTQAHTIVQELLRQGLVGSPRGKALRAAGNAYAEELFQTVVARQFPPFMHNRRTTTNQLKTDLQAFATTFGLVKKDGEWYREVELH